MRAIARKVRASSLLDGLYKNAGGNSAFADLGSYGKRSLRLTATLRLLQPA